MARIDALLSRLVEEKGSDLHLGCGSPPRFRIRGHLEAVPGTLPLNDLEVGKFLVEITPPNLWKRYCDENDLDFAYTLPGVARFRVNLHRQVTGRGAVLRTIPEQIIPLEELRMPASVESLAHLRDGLVLVTGPTGSGKSTTLAAIVDCINRTYARHIVTIEDPVEFVHQNKKSYFSHREVGRHTEGFAPALRAAVRQDADVLLVGEMRDYETISLALTAAEMGLLVFGTLHTNSASKTIDRLIDAFPAAQQAQARLTLSESLAAVVSQLLLRSVDGKRRVAAVEVLLRSPGLGNVIRENNTSMIYSMMQSSKEKGMQTMDLALLGLLKEGIISQDDAYQRATDKGLFEKGGAAANAGAAAATAAPARK
ncbi:MAG: PilT/PilU family type 4a pilus ATPase [Deltaproteobacteria bacterium]|nr:PilT/PilU family type 4a pilus ATPase [Deltaproteobacteria bacterium]